jgi:hypothetical protein
VSTPVKWCRYADKAKQIKNTPIRSENLELRFAHTHARARAHACTHACTQPRRFAEVSRLTDETERLVDENAKLRGVIDELRLGHSELQSDTERREVEAQRIVHSTQKVPMPSHGPRHNDWPWPRHKRWPSQVIAELNQKLVGLQEELESKHARAEWLLVEKEWKEKDIEQVRG